MCAQASSPAAWRIARRLTPASSSAIIDGMVSVRVAPGIGIITGDAQQPRQRHLLRGCPTASATSANAANRDPTSFAWVVPRVATTAGTQCLQLTPRQDIEVCPVARRQSFARRPLRHRTPIPTRQWRDRVLLPSRSIIRSVEPAPRPSVVAALHLIDVCHRRIATMMLVEIDARDVKRPQAAPRSA